MKLMLKKLNAVKLRAFTQADSYNDYYAKHGGESRSVAN